MTKINVLVLGGSGMLGSTVVDCFSNNINFTVTATVRNQVLLATCQKKIPSVQWKLFDVEKVDSEEELNVMDGCNWVVNAIGITKPMVHDDDPLEVERAIRINSLFPHILAKKANSIGAKVLQIATDCVFSGSKGSYIEKDVHDAKDVYGKTKSLGEVACPCMHHLRCSIVGPEPKDYKFLVEWFRNQPHGSQVNGYVNHLWNGITTLHFAKIASGIIQSNLDLPLVQHIIPYDQVTKAEMLKLFSSVYQRHDIIIKNVEAGQVIDRTLLTDNDALNQNIWRAAGYNKPPTISEMITEMAKVNYQLTGITIK